MESQIRFSNFAERIKKEFGKVKDKDHPYGKTYTVDDLYEIMDSFDIEDNSYKAKYPIRYFITEKLFGVVDNVLNFPSDSVNNVRYWITNYFIHRPDRLSTTLNRGQYYDFRERMIDNLFSSLVDFVEIESVPHYQRKFWRRCKRSTEHVAELFKWQTEQCDNPPQSIHWLVIQDLYNWWKFERPARIDPYSVDYVKWDYERIFDIEAANDAEDQAMLHRLIDIRLELWD
jgi:hypothetical protein